MAGRVTWLTSTKRRMSESAGYGYVESCDLNLTFFLCCHHRVRLVHTLHPPTAATQAYDTGSILYRPSPFITEPVAGLDAFLLRQKLGRCQ